MNLDPEQINHVLACLWHTSKTFNINRLEKDASILSHLPHRVKMIMYWYIIGSLAYLANGFPRIFPEMERVMVVSLIRKCVF